ncbi:MAG: hypothetical protein IPI11_17815 [Haliscomenobacter sp.]|nr:hypothetical protein [Haliscomenobacter sp.]
MADYSRCLRPEFTQLVFEELLQERESGAPAAVEDYLFTGMAPLNDQIATALRIKPPSSWNAALFWIASGESAGFCGAV